MSLTLIYSDCISKSAGDYSAAAEIAYDLQNYYYRINEKSQCILASSPGGVNKFKSLYGSGDGLSQLKIHGMPFEVVKLNEFIEDQRIKNVDRYMEVAICEPPPIEQVAKIVDPLSTKVLVVGLPHYPLKACKKFVAKRFPQSYANKLAHTVATGFGKNRIGLPIYKDSFEPLIHKNYAGITRKHYGFAYYKGGLQHGSKSTIIDYLKIAISLTTPYENFVFVGDCQLNFEAINEFAISSRKSIEVIDQSTKQIYKIVNKSGENFDSLDITNVPMPSDYEVRSFSKDTIRICLVDKVQNEQMHSLLKFSQPLICSEGVNTPIEAIAFKKIPFMHYTDNNEGLYTRYHKAVLKACPSSLRDRMESFLSLCVRHSSLSDDDTSRLISFLSDKNLMKAYLKINAELINSADPAQRIVEQLQQPGTINSSYTGQAFEDDTKRRLALDLAFAINELMRSSSTYSSSPYLMGERNVCSKESAKQSPLMQNGFFNKQGYISPKPVTDFASVHHHKKRRV